MTRREIDILDKMWADLVKDIAKHVCEHCHISGVRMEAAHVVGRRHRATRWGSLISGSFDLCGHCFCHNCHQQYDEHGPREQGIINNTIGVLRKAFIQQRALELVAKGQFFDDVKAELEKQRGIWESKPKLSPVML